MYGLFRTVGSNPTLSALSVLRGRPTIRRRAVAQFGSAPYWGCGGRRFKSCQPDFEGSAGSKLPRSLLHRSASPAAPASIGLRPTQSSDLASLDSNPVSPTSAGSHMRPGRFLFERCGRPFGRSSLSCLERMSWGCLGPSAVRPFLALVPRTHVLGLSRSVGRSAVPRSGASNACPGVVSVRRPFLAPLPRAPVPESSPQVGRR